MSENQTKRMMSKNVKEQINYTAIGHHMKDIRKRRGCTQEYLAGQMGISLNFYASLENGKNQINLARLLQFAVLMDTSPNEIVAGSYLKLKETSSPEDSRTQRKAFDSLLDQCSDSLLMKLYDVCHLLVQHANRYR